MAPSCNMSVRPNLPELKDARVLARLGVDWFPLSLRFSRHRFCLKPSREKDQASLVVCVRECVDG